MNVGDVVTYLTDDRYEVDARVVKIDKTLGRVLVEYNDVREWLAMNDLWLQRGDVVEVDGVPTRVKRCFHDGDVATERGLHYRSHLTKAKVST